MVGNIDRCPNGNYSNAQSVSLLHFARYNDDIFSGLHANDWKQRMLTDFQIQKYLDRIGITEPLALDKHTLDKMVFAHQTAVPFETVTLHRSGRAPSLDVDDIYEKIVERRLGGYCFELNKLFEELLKGLGFDARPIYSRAVRGREGRMPINHRGIIVKLDEDIYSADVGFGGPMPAGALQIIDGPDQDIRGEIFAVKQADDAWWKIERITRANFDNYDDELPARRQVELELCTASVEEQDFDALNEFFARPGTLFRDHELVNLRTKDGYLGYKDGVLTIRQNGEKQLRDVPSDEVNAVLAEVFGMENL